VNSISGGTRWHWRAWRRAQSWRALSHAIDRYHRDFGPAGGELLLLGCSAGWMVQTSWLRGFSSVIAVDLDPLACWLFRLRHRGLARLKWYEADALEMLDSLLTEYPRAAVFFDNMLGQQALIAMEKGKASASDLSAVESSLSLLKQRLEGRVWGSLHDRLSGPVRIDASGYKRCASQPMLRSFGNAQSHDELIGWLAQIHGLQAYGEWLDHLTGGVFGANTARAYLLWPFERDYWHWLEMAWVQPERTLVT